MNIVKSEKLVISLSRDEVIESIVFWLSRSLGNTETCKLACYLHNEDNAKIKLSKGILTIEVTGDVSEKEIDTNGKIKKDRNKRWNDTSNKIYVP